MSLDTLTCRQLGISNTYNEPNQQIIHQKYLSYTPFPRALDVLRTFLYQTLKNGETRFQKPLIFAVSENNITSARETSKKRHSHLECSNTSYSAALERSQALTSE